MNNDTNVNTFSASAHWQANDRFSFSMGLAYSMAEMEMEDVSFASDPFDFDLDNDGVADNDVSPTAGIDLDDDAGTLEWAGEYDPANTNNIESYSDLEYDVWDLNLSASYAISDMIGLNANYVYSDTDDEAGGYVYGDEDGTYQSLMTNVTFRF